MHYLKPLFSTVLLCWFAASFAQQNTPPKNIGIFEFDKNLDDSAFHICNRLLIFQYYGFTSYFKTHKDEIRDYFLTHFIQVEDCQNQDGYMTLRFIINCKGELGRFRMIEMDAECRSNKFDPRISGQLLRLAKGMKNWKPVIVKGTSYDTYQYITFKLLGGKIMTISP